MWAQPKHPNVVDDDYPLDKNALIEPTVQFVLALMYYKR